MSSRTRAQIESGDDERSGMPRQRCTAPTGASTAPRPRLTAQVHPVLLSSFAALNSAGVRWCVLRPPRSYQNPTGDLDLLIHPDDTPRVAPALEAIDYVRYPMQPRCAESVFLRFDKPTACWLRLHLVSELAFGRPRALVISTAADVVERRVIDGEIAQPDPDDAFWALLLHCLLDKRHVADRHREALKQTVALARADGPLARRAASICPTGWTLQRIITSIRNGDWDALERSAPRLLAQARRTQSLRDQLNAICDGALVLVGKVRARLRRCGVSVAVLGPDGAGKSTLARNIARHFFADVRVLYMGSGATDKHPHVPLALRLRIPGLGAPGRILVLWSRWLAGLAHRWRGRLVLFDRYPYDALVRQREGVSRPYRFSLLVQAHACPPPHLILLLDAPGDMMFQRKGERDPKALETDRNHFREMLERRRGVQILDATRSEEALCRDAIEEIWKLYRSRWQR